MAKKKFFILDGSSLLYRAFYALPLLEAESGVYTNAIVGFSNMLVKLLGDWQPDAMVIAFDKGKHTFRTDMFAEYKGTRKPMPEELRSQVPMLREMAEAWGIPLIELEGYEADDIIGTLANKAVAEGMAAYVVTGDRDALQLVKQDLTVLFTKKGISDIMAYDEAAFQAEYSGLDPIQLIDLKGLMGDTSDNIPGVPKVGPKTAIKLISAYGSVEQVLLHVEEVSGNALKERLRENQEQAMLSKKLATIRLDVPVEFNEEEFALALDGEALAAFYGKYNIRAVLRHVKKLAEGTMGVKARGVKAGQEGSAGAGEAEDTGQAGLQLPQVQVLTEAKAGKALLQKALQAGCVYLCPVFEGKVPHKKLLGMGVALATGKSSGASGQAAGSGHGKMSGTAAAQGEGAVLELYYLSVAEAAQTAGMGNLFAELAEEAAENPAWLAFKEIFTKEKLTIYTHGSKGLYHVGLEPAGRVVDLELVGYLLNPASDKYALEELAAKYGRHGADMPAADQKCPEEQKQGQQAAFGAWTIWAIGDTMVQKLQKLGMQRLYEEMEFPLVQVLADMEQLGIVLNPDKLAVQGREAGEKIQELAKEIYYLAGREFNIGSPKQLGVVLFEDLQLPVIKKTKTGYSTNVEVLNELYNLHPIIEKVLEYRQWTKLKSTYLDGLAPLIDVDTKRVHTSFNQTVTATGRLSSSEPNLQNIPVRREEGRHIREMFEPGEGYDLLVSADYSQIELRVLADMSQDASFLKAFRENEDIHARTAAEVFGVSIDAVDKDLRRKAKAVNFGIVYGISDYGLSQDLHISRYEAKEYIDKYFEKCPGVKAFIDNTVAEAAKQGYVLTKYGRRRDLPGLRSSNYNQRSLAERMAMNTPIQGTAADIIKLAMIRAYRALKAAGLKSRILLQVHDELVLEAVASELPQVESILHEAMEQAVELSVPLTIDINTGKNWAEAK